MAGTEPHAWGTGRVDDITHLGLGVHKATIYVALAESGRSGEVREVGVFENPRDPVQDGGKARQRLGAYTYIAA